MTAAASPLERAREAAVVVAPATATATAIVHTTSVRHQCPVLLSSAIVRRAAWAADWPSIHAPDSAAVPCLRLLLQVVCKGGRPLQIVPQARGLRARVL